MGIASSWALSNLLPALSPAKSQVVFDVTEPVTFAPAHSNNTLISSLANGSVPVRTTTCHESAHASELISEGFFDTDGKKLTP